jgi:hypothetical protein
MDEGFPKKEKEARKHETNACFDQKWHAEPIDIIYKIVY